MARLLFAQRIRFVAIDADVEQVDFFRKFGNPIYYGDPSKPDLLRSAGADRRKNRNSTEEATHEDAVVEEQTDYHAETVALLQSPEYGPHAPNSVKRRNARSIRHLMLRYSVWIEEDDWRAFYSLLVAGDPKSRTSRALYTLFTRRKGLAYEQEERDRERAAAAATAAATDTTSTDDTTTEGPTDE